MDGMDVREPRSIQEILDAMGITCAVEEPLPEEEEEEEEEVVR